MYMNVLPVCAYVCFICAWCLWRSKEVKFPRTAVTDVMFVGHCVGPKYQTWS